MCIRDSGHGDAGILSGLKSADINTVIPIGVGDLQPVDNNVVRRDRNPGPGPTAVDLGHAAASIGPHGDRIAGRTVSFDCLLYTSSSGGAGFPGIYGLIAFLIPQLGFDIMGQRHLPHLLDHLIKIALIIKLNQAISPIEDLDHLGLEQPFAEPQPIPGFRPAAGSR